MRPLVAVLCLAGAAGCGPLRADMAVPRPTVETFRPMSQSYEIGPNAEDHRFTVEWSRLGADEASFTARFVSPWPCNNPSRYRFSLRSDGGGNAGVKREGAVAERTVRKRKSLPREIVVLEGTEEVAFANPVLPSLGGVTFEVRSLPGFDCPDLDFHFAFTDDVAPAPRKVEPAIPAAAKPDAAADPDLGPPPPPAPDAGA